MWWFWLRLFLAQFRISSDNIHGLRSVPLLRWSQQVKLTLTLESFRQERGQQQHELMVKPNIPVELPSVRLTFTSISGPRHRYSTLDALSDYRCAAAESKVVCECPTIDTEEEFNHLEAKLPINTATWERNDQEEHGWIPDMVSADLSINFHSTLDTISLLIYNDQCSVENTELHGCYRWSQGAQAKIRCTSDNDTLGEILCDQESFVVPCSQQSQNLCYDSTSIPVDSSLTVRYHVDPLPTTSCSREFSSTPAQFHGLCSHA
ncbi:hypothetical protein COOONC_02668 [Cooperia oncophora]